MIITFEIDHVIWTIDKSRDCKISHDKNTQRVSAAYSALFSPAVMSLRPSTPTLVFFIEKFQKPGRNGPDNGRGNCGRYRFVPTVFGSPSCVSQKMYPLIDTLKRSHLTYGGHLSYLTYVSLSELP